MQFWSFFLTLKKEKRGINDCDWYSNEAQGPVSTYGRLLSPGNPNDENVEKAQSQCNVLPCPKAFALHSSTEFSNMLSSIIAAVQLHCRPFCANLLWKEIQLCGNNSIIMRRWRCIFKAKFILLTCKQFCFWSSRQCWSCSTWSCNFSFWNSSFLSLMFWGTRKNTLGWGF